VFLGGCRQQQGPLAVWSSGRALGRRQAAQGRDRRRAHHQVQLGPVQPLLHRNPGARRSALPVHAGALSQEVPSEVHRRRSGRQLALYPNLNSNDAEWRKLFRDTRFRRALSTAIDREELNQVIYLGLGTPSNNSIMPRSELFKPEYATRWATYDPQLAGRLLD